MKKRLLSLAVILSAATTLSAQTVTFEDLTLSSESHNDESDDAGAFTSGDVSFLNFYDTDFDYWASGWTYSNMTDVNTPGWLNPYSSFAGEGAGGSENFGVFYAGYLGLESTIDFGSQKIVGSMEVTNTTYAALSMRDGDDFGKVFGSPNDANDTPDGTNGEDFFRVLVIGHDADSAVTDTVIFYLADFRFSDNSQDYILDEWSTVDLSPLGEVRYLAFVFESSDTGAGGINTPAYFAMDNMSFGTAGVKEEAKNLSSVYPNPARSVVKIEGEAGIIRIFNNAGQLIASQATNGTAEMVVEGLENGVYIVEMTSDSGISRSSFVKQ